jgi:hypothetical protein
MAKAKATPVKQEEKLITLTKEQYQKLLSVRQLLDDASDALDNIDGNESIFDIGKQVGSTYADLILAYNELSEVVMDKQMEVFSDEDSDDEDTWTFA